VDFQVGLRGMVEPWLENPTWKYAEVGKKIAGHDFCKWLLPLWFSNGGKKCNRRGILLGYDYCHPW